MQWILLKLTLSLLNIILLYLLIIKISEDIFGKLVKDKRKKTAYDLLTNDAYLNRFFEKSVIK